MGSLVGNGLSGTLPKEPEMWAKYLVAKESFWHPSPLDTVIDDADWTFRLNDGLRKALLRTLASLSAIKSIVADHLMPTIVREVGLVEASRYLELQTVVEHIHLDTYDELRARLLSSCPDAAIRVCTSAEDYASQAKTAWAMRLVNDPSKGLEDRLLAFMCLERIYTASFSILVAWLRKRAFLPRMCRLVDLICRDEDRHVKFARDILNHLRSCPSLIYIKSMVSEAVALETEFAADYPALFSLEKTSGVADYIKHRADDLVTSLGCPKLYHACNPFEVRSGPPCASRPTIFERRIVSHHQLPLLGDIHDVLGPFSASAFGY
ncbi:ferritin-like superfamily [Ephemerocybe angulata]|uniref:Ferritin-like superfamily n=1 Tax=Ephemerocybe angulata TaxID=980116 RepID=A0A8H6I0U9_9AGAR|nr:ferritin-like superfamily [Tulosesus angulatus]